MKWEGIESENGCRQIQVVAGWEEIAADYDDIVSEYSHLSLPGFRPGKVPRSVIEQRFREQMLDDLWQRAAQRLGKEALRKAATECLGPIEISIIECLKGKPLRFVARFRPMPEFEVPDIMSLVIEDNGTDPRDQISYRLLETVSFAVPDDVVRSEMGTDEIDCGKESPVWKAAEDRVRLLLILKRIAREEGIDVTEADVERRIKEKAFEFGTNPDALRAELEGGRGRQRLKDMLLAEGTLDYITERTTHMKGGLT
jgi:FKBP-type peptidyl-prolyl cis-trans isomerase (trigger factor)